MAGLTDELRVTDGFDLAAVDPRSTPGLDGGKTDGKKALADGTKGLSELQERLFAEGRGGGTRSLLLVVQGMDTSGKGDIMRHVVGAVDPQGVELTSFKAPTAEELSHDFLWRIRRALPAPGMIGVFDRSHYEDVLIVRVHDLVPETEWATRYDTINAFEAELAETGTAVVKVMLHISRDEQKARLLERLDRPDKHWSTTPATSTSAGTGTPTPRPTQKRCGAARRPPRGTSSPPTASGTRAWPCTRSCEST
ncbi:MAG TPA: hypothetical protein VFD41_03755 [Actinomycetales bacterium]|nr:hypothetical protein [Actinomycetales bacterium]